ncbi:MAG: hypothetical protein M1823_001701 [Watsoniomyces obsoletus]|nr:MAG: hypothetical protein M1823_001701 [Watsoniomyces obsoletus]
MQAEELPPILEKPMILMVSMHPNELSQPGDVSPACGTPGNEAVIADPSISFRPTVPNRYGTSKAGRDFGLGERHVFEALRRMLYCAPSSAPGWPHEELEMEAHPLSTPAPLPFWVACAFRRWTSKILPWSELPLRWTKETLPQKRREFTFKHIRYARLAVMVDDDEEI